MKHRKIFRKLHNAILKGLAAGSATICVLAVLSFDGEKQVPVPVWLVCICFLAVFVSVNEKWIEKRCRND